MREGGKRVRRKLEGFDGKKKTMDFLSARKKRHERGKEREKVEEREKEMEKEKEEQRKEQKESEHKVGLSKSNWERGPAKRKKKQTRSIRRQLFSSAQSPTVETLETAESESLEMEKAERRGLAERRNLALRRAENLESKNLAMEQAESLETAMEKAESEDFASSKPESALRSKIEKET